MAFCQNCGQQMPENANVCPYCGTAVNAQAAQQAVQAAPQQETAQQAPQQNYTAPVNPTVMPDQDVQQSRGLAWLSYVGLLFLIPMFVKKESPYCQYHVKQGATLFATELAYTITTKILLVIINAIFPGHWETLFYYSYYTNSTVYTIFDTIFWLGSIFFVVMSIIGIVNAAKGNKKDLPLISKIPWINTLLDKTVYKKNA